MSDVLLFMLTLSILRRATPANVQRLARALGVVVYDGEPHRMLCHRVIVAIGRSR